MTEAGQLHNGRTMAWDQRGYYYRSHKVNGKVEREYVGRGRVAELVAQLDQIEREQRERERESWKAEKEALEALEDQLSKLIQFSDLVAQLAMHAAGYHQHHRSWRRKRHGQSYEEGQ